MCKTGSSSTDSSDGATRRGALIVLEGLDRSGKSTQAERLLAHFIRTRGEGAARIQSFPDRTEPGTGPRIDAFLRGARSPDAERERMHALFAENRWAREATLRAELSAGTHLVLDRYSHSGVAYSLAKGLPPELVYKTEIDLPRPDLVLFFDVSPEKTAQRGGFGDETMERVDFQRRVYAHFQALFDPQYWQRIDACAPVDVVHGQVVAAVERLLQKQAQEAGQSPPLKNFTAADFGGIFPEATENGEENNKKKN